VFCACAPGGARAELDRELAELVDERGDDVLGLARELDLRVALQRFLEEWFA